MRISIAIFLAAGIALALALALTDAHAQGRCCAARGSPTTCNPC